MIKFNEFCFEEIDKKIWKNNTGKNIVIKHENDEKFIFSEETDLEYKNDEILNEFLENYIVYKEAAAEEQILGIEQEQEQEQEQKKSYPYDPELIRVDSKMFSVKYIHELLNPETEEEEEEEKKIDLSTDFQRNFVWNDITRKSRLIESLLLRIPLPVFYLAQNKNGIFSVVDGIQRLTVMNDFINGKFCLKNLEYLKNCEGKFFKKLGKDNLIDKEKSLDGTYRKRINETQLICNIIDPQTPTAVKYDIFKRINTGGKVLNNQEIRNCLAVPRVRNLLRNLSGLDIFKKATNNSIKAIRLDDQELILRYIAFYYSLKKEYREYTGNMKEYLDESLEFLAKQNFQELENDFKNSMLNCFYLFGEYAFRKQTLTQYLKKSRKPLINKSLFLGISLNLSFVKNEYIIKNYNKDFLLEKLLKKIEDDRDFMNCLTNGTNDNQKINYVINTIKNLLKENLGSDLL